MLTVTVGALDAARSFFYFAATLHVCRLFGALYAFSVPRLNYLPFQYHKRRSIQRSD